MYFNYLGVFIMRSISQYVKDKKGAVNVDSRITIMIGFVIILSIFVALAPTMFEGLDNITGAPSWVTVVLPIIVGAGVVLLIWRSIK